MLRKSALNLFSQIVGFLVSFGDRIVLVGLLVRGWGAGAYSDWATLLAVAGLFALAEFGYQIQYGNELSLAQAREDRQRYQRIVSVGLFFYTALALVLTTILGLAVVDLDPTRLFQLRAMSATEAKLVFWMLSMTSILHLARAGLSQIYRSQGEFHRGIFVDSLVSALLICTAVIAVFLGAGPVLLSIIYLVAEVVFGFGGMITDIKRRYRAVSLWPRPISRREAKSLRQTIGFYALIQGLPVIWLNMPVLVAGWLAMGGVGLVSFVVQRSLVNFGRTLATLLSMSVGIELATLVHKGALNQLERGVNVLAGLNATLAGGLAAGLFSFGPAVVTLWTGKSQLASPLMMAAFVLPAIVTSASAPISMLCMYANQPRPSGLALCLQIGLGVPLAFFAGKAFGVTGIAFGVATGEIIGAGIALPLFARRSFGITYAPLLLKCLVISGMVGLWGAAAGHVIIEVMGPRGIVKLVAAMSVWVIVAMLPAIVLVLPVTVRSAYLAAANNFCKNLALAAFGKPR